MPDALGYRAKLGVLVPSTNTIVEPDFYAMRGVRLVAARLLAWGQERFRLRALVT